MTALVVFDSVFGNTAMVARAVADELGAVAVPVSAAATIDWSGVTLLVVGSPTRGFRPTPAISEFCSTAVPANDAAMQAAAFDTRIVLETIHPAPLRWVVDAGGYAADRIVQMLGHRGLTLVGTHAGFLVGGQEGPLQEGELDRARAWAQTLVPAVATAG